MHSKFSMKTQQHTPLNILLADDDADDCYFFKEALKEFSVPTRFEVVDDGEQLMQILTNETGELPDVLFLDLNMPRKNGFECLSEIKSNKKTKQIPVIIYSTSFHKKVAEMLYKNGVHYYISKPSEISQLKKVIQDTITLIAHGNISQPAQENFVLTVAARNYKKLFLVQQFFKNTFFRGRAN